jgi:hypothetical protein
VQMQTTVSEPSVLWPCVSIETHTPEYMAMICPAQAAGNQLPTYISFRPLWSLTVLGPLCRDSESFNVKLRLIGCQASAATGDRCVRFKGEQ